MNKSCKARIKKEWEERQQDLNDPHYEALAFDYVEPHTFTDQAEGYWRWQFSWGGPSDELRGYVNESKELHRLEYWFLDWFDGASLLVSPGSMPWAQMQEMIPH
tara:strand:- start:54 stop:365 length:312 start_codon:yes stop_codon:yes gene_type:complete